MFFIIGLKPRRILSVSVAHSSGTLVEMELLTSIHIAETLTRSRQVSVTVNSALRTGLEPSP